jgi:ADP-heptose:LPS heptosyltransferase
VNPFKTLHHCMALIAEADLVISPDTSVVHMAAAWKKPLIAVYKDVRMNNRLWAPGTTTRGRLSLNAARYTSWRACPT